MANTLRNIQTLAALLTAMEDHDLSATARLLSDDFALSGAGPTPLGQDAYLGFQAVHNEAFADWRFNPATVTADGDMVTAIYQISATHTGAFDVAKLGLPIEPIAPTGKSRSWPVEQMTATVRDGKIVSLEVQTQPEGGVMGTLAWLGVSLPSPV
ncbi:MAG: nuclear transport factor 2 family protein [Chloroflexia bacterium]